MTLDPLNPPARTVLDAAPRRQSNVWTTAGGALAGWWRAATLDAAIVGVLWLVGLELLHVPLAPLWAFLGALCSSSRASVA